MNLWFFHLTKICYRSRHHKLFDNDILKFPESSSNHLHPLLLLPLPLVPLLSYYWLLWLWWLVSFELLKNLKQPVRTSFLIIYSPRSTTSSTRATISQSATTFKSGRKTLTGMDKHNSNIFKGRGVRISFLSLNKSDYKAQVMKIQLIDSSNSANDEFWLAITKYCI